MRRICDFKQIFSGAGDKLREDLAKKRQSSKAIKATKQSKQSKLQSKQSYKASKATKQAKLQSSDKATSPPYLKQIKQANYFSFQDFIQEKPQEFETLEVSLDT